MKRKLLIAGATLLVLSLLAVACAPAPTPTPTPTPEEKIVLRISSGLNPLHIWDHDYQMPFADRMEEAFPGRLEFERYHAAELCTLGKELECLKGGSIDVAAPFTAPYHVGVFPLTDVTMLPIQDTTSLSAARAFKKLLYSDVPLKEGKTFYELEIVPRGLKVWPLGPTEPYRISTSGKRFDKAEDFAGVPIRAGARTHCVYLEELGVTTISMKGMEIYEAITRGTIEGAIYSIPDWESYGLTELYRYTIVGIGLGHWPSYLAMLETTWDKLPADIQAKWDEVALDMCEYSARAWIAKGEPVMKENIEKYGGVFEDVRDLDPSVQEAMADACVGTWKRWIEEEEAKGNPALACARLWAEYIVEEGGTLPEGVPEYLGL